LVHHSGRVLQALTYQPTGAIVAAPTTSLPEQVGGGLNWDYRYSWVRDASFTMQALWVAACPDEAAEFFDFLTAAAAHSRPERPLQIMFGVGGEHDLSERVLPHLSGWRGSRPVRVGNGAWTQPQLDVYGELLGAAYRLRDQLGDLQPATRTLLVTLADAAAAHPVAVWGPDTTTATSATPAAPPAPLPGHGGVVGSPALIAAAHGHATSSMTICVSHMLSSA
jgi:GH15 family glucan-1,4-alpha-glucosidase